MQGWPRRVALALSFALFAALAPTTSWADHEDGWYELPALAWWDRAELTVLVVPPNHGQVFNEETGFVGGTDPGELTPFNSYLVAIEDAIAAWDTAVDRFAEEWLRTRYKMNVYVVGRDDVPADALTSPDILVVTDESEGTVLGTAVRLDPCIVRMSKVEIESFTYADMYNVTAQEFGHCLGLRHVGSQGGIEPTSEQKHPEHDVMNGFYTHWIGAAGTHLHCISNLDVLALETSFGMANPGPGTAMDGTLLMPVDAYGDTCSAPPEEWRTMLPAGQPGTPAQPPVSEIDNPGEGDVLRAQSFTRVFGTATSDDELIEEVSVALARKRGHGCEWWDPALAELVAGTCEEPLWSPAKGAERWRWSVGSVLPKGRYRVLARAATWSQQETCCEAGSNLVEFRLR